MTGWHRDHEPLNRELLSFNERVVDRLHDKPDVDISAANGGKLISEV